MSLSSINIILLVLVIVEGFIIIYLLYSNRDRSGNQQYSKKGDESCKCWLLRYKLSECQMENMMLRRKLEKSNLNEKNRDMTRYADERNKTVGNEFTSSFPETHKKSILIPYIPKSTSNETSSAVVPENPVSMVSQYNKNVAEDDYKDRTSTEKTMYASFPRTAGSSIYFSDLSEKRADDSYFELKISVIYEKATFKPIDFMKIRNYDPAMAAMFTEGVKPSTASTVLGIESGEAHKEGKDWIIDKPAKIKLA